jgi:UDP-N-acetyl-D-mannosaminuronate dehydrogenase
MQRPSTRSFWKIQLLNRGISPVKAEDPEVDPMIRRCVLDKKTLVATFTEDALKLADVVVVDVQCDYLKESLGDLKTGRADMEALEKSLYTIAQRIPEQALVLIETTVAPGTTEQVAYPIMKKTFERRGIASEPLLAHSYERVMPGREYVKSIRDFWRVCSGVNEESKRRVAKFLNKSSIRSNSLSPSWIDPSNPKPPRSSRTATAPPFWPSSTNGAFSRNKTALT